MKEERTKKSSLPFAEIEIVFQPYGKRAKFPPGIVIMDAGKTLGVDLSSLCSGKGTCGKCKIKVQKGADGLSPLTEKELKHLSEEELNASFRLACQAQLTTPSVIYVPLIRRVGVQRLQTEGLDVPVKPNPFVRKYFLQMPQPTLHDNRSDEDRLLDSLTRQFGLSNLKIDFEAAKSLPINLRKENYAATAVIWNNEIRAVEPGDTSDRCYGLAEILGPRSWLAS